ncbi:MAG: DNA topoisomerase VI subunit B [Candidatus ainarchaeum sp.]|nr:DNA topoisomerase VI subunit B [Candidatus ainarchaeum sp.]
MSEDKFSASFKESSVAEFFKRNRQMLGLYGKLRSLTTVIAEYVCNSLDACEEAGILPEIIVKIIPLGEEHYEVHVIDNGPGIPKDKVGKALGKLLAGTKFHRLIQTRGQQGIGASGCILLSQVTTGKPSKIISGTGGKPLYMELEIDTAKNEPKIKLQKELDYDYRGIAVKSEFKEVNYQNSSQNALEYLKRTAIANPHATIKYTDPFNNTYIFERSSGYIPKTPKEIKPHIKCITVDELKTLAKDHSKKTIAGLFKQEFDRVGDKVIKDINSLLDFDISKVTMSKANWEMFEKVVKAIDKTKTFAPRLDTLIPIEEKYLEESLRKIIKPEFLSVLSRKPTVYHGGYPIQIEVAIAYGGDAGQTLANNEKKLELMRFANRAPLLFDAGACGITKAVNSIEWRRYGLKDIENLPLSILVNLSSVHIPYTSAGKQAIAEEEEIVEEIRKALMTAARSLGLHLSKKRHLETKMKKRGIFLNYAKEVAEGLHLLTDRNKKELIDKLEDIITKKLQIEEMNEQEESEDISEGEIPEDAEEKKSKGKKDKITDYFEADGDHDE